MKVKMTFDKGELETLIKEKACRGNLTPVGDIQWDWDPRGEDPRMEVSVEVRQMTPEEIVDAGLDTRPLEERVAAALETRLRESLYGMARELDRLVGERVELMTENFDARLSDELTENFDDWGNLLVGKLDRIREALAILGRGTMPAPASPAPTTGEGPVLPPPPVNATGRRMTEEEKAAQERLRRVREEQEKEAVEFEASRGRRRSALDGEEEEFPADMRILE